MGKDKCVRRWAIFSITLFEYSTVKEMSSTQNNGWELPIFSYDTAFFQDKLWSILFHLRCFVEQVMEHRVLGRSILTPLILVSAILKIL